MQVSFVGLFSSRFTQAGVLQCDAAVWCCVIQCFAVCVAVRLHTSLIKLQVIVRKRATNYRALSRKMKYKDKATCGCSPPCIHIFTSLLQPIADKVAQNLEMISKNFQFSTRRTRILMGFIIYYWVLIVNPMGRILVRWKSFRNHLEMLCYPICNRL